MRLLVVIVNYRSAGLTVDCLRSLAPEIARVEGGARVIVTDNASGDDSVPSLTRAVADNDWGGWAIVQPLEHNGGFAYGNNAAIRPALASIDKPDYVLLLNPDTVVRPDALAALLDFMDANPSAGLAGSRLEHPDGAPQRSAFRFHSVASELEAGLRIGLVSKLLQNRVVAPPVPRGTEPRRVDWVAGASLIVRRRVFETAGLLDEAYFMYFEEVDFCLRARRRMALLVRAGVAGGPSCWAELRRDRRQTRVGQMPARLLVRFAAALFPHESRSGEDVPGGPGLVGGVRDVPRQAVPATKARHRRRAALARFRPVQLPGAPVNRPR